MITVPDALLLLSEIQKSGVDITKYTHDLLTADFPSVEIINFINQHRPLDITNFYKKLRKSYNNGRSKLYSNIVKENLEGKDIITCLCSLQLQIMLFAKNIENYTMFLRHARVEEISKVLLNYYKTADLVPCQELLALFKADLKALGE